MSAHSQNDAHSRPTNATQQDSTLHQSNILLTVLWSHDSPMTKRYTLDAETCQVVSQDYGNSKWFRALPAKASDIHGLGDLIKDCSANPHYCLIRGVHPSGKKQPRIDRTKKNFPEHSDGTCFVMLDIDGVTTPEGVSPWKPEAIDWFITEHLPAEFHDVTCFYQFSSSAGILGADGTPHKSGLRVHLYFYLDRRIPGRLLAAYLQQHCLDTGFYEKKANKGGVPMLQYGIDLAPIKTSVQVHYIALPILDKGVCCALVNNERQGFRSGDRDEVTVPALPADLNKQVQEHHDQVKRNYKIELGYVRRTLQSQTREGFTTTTYYAPPSEHSQVRTGRILTDYKLQDSFCRLFFEDENTPGSWYVCRKIPQWAFRYGDGEKCPLKELSESANTLVRDELQWFTEVPHQSLALQDNGFVPAIDSFAAAEYSLVLAPTGSGKTTAVIDWMMKRSRQDSVIYTAPTIPLVDQMRDDLNAQDAVYVHYKALFHPNNATESIFITTNASLPKVLDYINQGYGTSYYLVVDEVHRALDDYCQSNRKLGVLHGAMRGAKQTLFMTGTLTDVQRQMLAQQVADLDKSRLNESLYCCYEFEPVKNNPLTLCQLAAYKSDVIRLFRGARDDLEAGRDITPTVIMMDTSRMKVFHQLASQFGLESHSMIVSRPENTPEEIDQARRGDKPILICSPLFALGLNFAWQPHRLWCLFRYIQADTNAIIQTINRANRGDVSCEVRIYAGSKSILKTENYKQPRTAHVRERLEAWFEGELNLPVDDSVDMPMLLDRNVYNVARRQECHSNRSLKLLIESDGFQNYRVGEPAFEAFERNKADEQLFKDACKTARLIYDDAVLTAHRPDNGFPDPVWDFEETRQERRRRFKFPEGARTELEIQTDDLARVMALCNLSEVRDARQASIAKLRVLMADRNPWLTERYYDTQQDNQAAADKIGRLLALVNVFRALRNGSLNGRSLAARLVRGARLEQAFCSLETDERGYTAMCERFEDLRKKRKKAHKSGSKSNRNAADHAAIKLMLELLHPIGVTFKRDEKGNELIDQPIIPANWDLDAMESRLKQRRAILQSLSANESIKRMPDTGSDRPDAVDVMHCRDCIYFYDVACAKGFEVDLSEVGSEGTLAGPLNAMRTVSHCQHKKVGSWVKYG